MKHSAIIFIVRKYLLIVFVLAACLFPTIDIALANTIIIDNGDPETSSPGSWHPSNAPNSYGNQSAYSRKKGDWYAFKASLAMPGEYQLFVRWTEWANRRTSVPYQIAHLGGTDTVKVNQRINGGKWVKLGTWTFGQVATITLNSLGDGSTCADAIKLVPISTSSNTNSPPTLAPIADKTVVAGNRLQLNVSATDNDGAPPVLSANTLPPNAAFVDANNGTGQLTWDTLNNDTGTYKVNFVATDTGNPSITSTVSVKITVVEKNSANHILDDGESGTTHIGNWNISSAPNPYGINSVYSRTNGGSYTFNFNSIAPGEYKVFARWTEWGNRRTNVPYVITHLSGKSTVSVNQRQNGGHWNQLGNTWKFGNNATIVVKSLGNDTTSADAIMLEAVKDTVLQVDFENRARNSHYSETHLIDDFNANSRDAVIHGPDWGNTRVVDDPAGTGRGNVLKVRHQAGKYGFAMKFKARFAPDNENKKGSARFDDIYFAFDLYLQPGYKPMMMHKLPGLLTGTLLEAGHASGVQPKPDGINTFIARLQSYSSGTFNSRPYEGALASYTYDSESTMGYRFLDTADPTQQNASRSYTIPQGQWITIEQRVKLNTADSNDAYNRSVDLKDGLHEIWIDGIKMLSKTHLWRWTNTMKADGIHMSSYYNDTATTKSLGQTPPPTDQFEYYDNFRVSTTPITH